jgi:hypothetical protein
MNIFVDCDVLLDVGLGRKPFCQASGELLAYLEANPHQGGMAWHSVANLFYIMGKATGREQTKSFVVKLCQFLQIVPTGTNDVLIAANLPFKDFEDAMQCAAAMAGEATVIVSRNVADYQNSPIRAVTPTQMLQELGIQTGNQEFKA